MAAQAAQQNFPPQLRTLLLLTQTRCAWPGLGCLEFDTGCVYFLSAELISQRCDTIVVRYHFSKKLVRISGLDYGTKYVHVLLYAAQQRWRSCLARSMDYAAAHSRDIAHVPLPTFHTTGFPRNALPTAQLVGCSTHRATSAYWWRHQETRYPSPPVRGSCFDQVCAAWPI